MTSAWRVIQRRHTMAQGFKQRTLSAHPQATLPSSGTVSGRGPSILRTCTPRRGARSCYRARRRCTSLFGCGRDCTPRGRAAAGRIQGARATHRQSSREYSAEARRTRGQTHLFDADHLDRSFDPVCHTNEAGQPYGGTISIMSNWAPNTLPDAFRGIGVGVYSTPTSLLEFEAGVAVTAAMEDMVFVGVTGVPVYEKVPEDATDSVRSPRQPRWMICMGTFVSLHRAVQRIRVACSPRANAT